MTSGFSPDSAQSPPGFPLSELAEQICRLESGEHKEEEAADADADAVGLYHLMVDERNLHKHRDAIDPISIDNIDVLDEWVSEEPSLLCRDDLNWERIDAPFAEPTSEDEEFVAIDDEEAPTASLSWPAAAAEDSYCPPPDQDPYQYVTQEDGILPF
uniref:Uncharacterized protein n=1 Tax=Oryza rufipogon TaxID=4529 RepID=A0A0E0QTB2_ORYRU